MRPVSETGTAVKILVDEFNANQENHPFPVLALQFVSLDNIREGKMIWWNYLHHSVAEQYLMAIKEFTGKNEESPEIKHTLINWEYDDAAYWYRDLGKKPIIELATAIAGSDFLDVTVDVDQSGVERECADIAEKERLLNKVWLDALKSNFGSKGSTMWVSLPHKDMRGDTIYSSIFCVFNAQVVEPASQLKTARLFRNFIVDYIIDRYKEPLQSELDAIKSVLTINDYKPESFSYTGDGRKSSVKKICDQYFQPHHISHFEKAWQRAHERLVKDHLDSNAGRPVLDYKPLHKINIKVKQDFFQLIYGRFLFLANFIVCEHSLELSFKKISGKTVTQEYVVNILGIDGLQKDRPDASGKKARRYEPDKIIPFISTAEYRFLLRMCDVLCKANHFKTEIVVARPLAIR